MDQTMNKAARPQSETFVVGLLRNTGFYKPPAANLIGRTEWMSELVILKALTNLKEHGTWEKLFIGDHSDSAHRGDYLDVDTALKNPEKAVHHIKMKIIEPGNNLAYEWEKSGVAPTQCKPLADFAKSLKGRSINDLTSLMPEIEKVTNEIIAKTKNVSRQMSAADLTAIRDAKLTSSIPERKIDGLQMKGVSPLSEEQFAKLLTDKNTNVVLQALESADASMITVSQLNQLLNHSSSLVVCAGLRKYADYAFLPIITDRQVDRIIDLGLKDVLRESASGVLTPTQAAKVKESSPVVPSVHNGDSALHKDSRHRIKNDPCPF